MKSFYNARYKKQVYEIYSGEYHATRQKDAIIATLLGSCVSACLMDRASGIIGMNHIMLPGDCRRQDLISDPDAKYGMHAMEMLINTMMKMGAARSSLEAKVFGGGQILGGLGSSVAANNVQFILTYLAMENIPIIARDLGGLQGRRILFFADSTDVLMRKVDKTTVYDLDKATLEKTQKTPKKGGELTFFD